MEINRDYPYDDVSVHAPWKPRQATLPHPEMLGTATNWTSVMNRVRELIGTEQCDVVRIMSAAEFERKQWEIGQCTPLHDLRPPMPVEIILANLETAGQVMYQDCNDIRIYKRTTAKAPFAFPAQEGAVEVILVYTKPGARPS